MPLPVSSSRYFALADDSRLLGADVPGAGVLFAMAGPSITGMLVCT